MIFSDENGKVWQCVIFLNDAGFKILIFETIVIVRSDRMVNNIHCRRFLMVPIFEVSN